MSGEKTIDDFLDQLIQTKVSLRHLIEDCQEKINHSEVDTFNRMKYNQTIFILKFRYDQLDMIQSEIKYLVADNVREIQKI
jgi:hypothetical protein